VLYKEVSNSQADNSRDSRELEYKDSCKFVPDSALLDSTRPATAGVPLSPELVCNDEPVPETQHSPLCDNLPKPGDNQLPAILYHQKDWTALTTSLDIMHATGNQDNTACHLCQQIFTKHHHLRVHLPQHYVTTFCACGEL